MADDERIVVTGIGCVSPLGGSVGETWAGLAAGRSGLGPITTVPLHGRKINVAGEITYDVTGWVPEKHLTMLDRFSVLAVAAAGEAITDSGLEIDAGNELRIGAVVGVGICGWEAIEAEYVRALEQKAKHASAFTVPRVMPGAAAGQVSMIFGLRGPVFGVTSACSSANHAIITGMQMIRTGMADAVVVGGTDAPIIPGILRAWDALRIHARDTCRPFCNTRRGLVLAEGAGIAVLERADRARARGARIRAEIIGGGMTADAADLYSPSEDGPANAIRICLDSARIDPGEVDYINAHGTGTRINDAVETRAIRRALGRHADDVSVSSTKSMLGHALGAAGAIELVACIKAMEEGLVPPTANYQEPDPECDLDVTPNEARRRTVNVAMSNAFAFGGLNAVIALRRYDA